MALTMDECAKLKAAGYSEHDIAQIAKVATPVIVKLARFGMGPQNPIEGVNVEALLKARKQVEPETKASESGAKEAEKPALEKHVETPKNEGKK